MTRDLPAYVTEAVDRMILVERDGQGIGESRAEFVSRRSLHREAIDTAISRAIAERPALLPTTAEAEAMVSALMAESLPVATSKRVLRPAGEPVAHDRALKLLEIIEAMTPGPWLASRTRSRIDTAQLGGDGETYDGYSFGPLADDDSERWDGDAAGIVALRNNAGPVIRELLAALDEANAARREAVLAADDLSDLPIMAALDLRAGLDAVASALGVDTDGTAEAVSTACVDRIRERTRGPL